MRHLVGWAAVVLTAGVAGLASAGVPATTGDVTLKAAWKTGGYDWPSAFPKPALNDWRGYDRLVMDVTNLADDGDVVTLVISSPDTPKNDGPRRYLRAPAWQTVRWEFPIAYFEDGKASVTNVSKMQLYCHRPKGVDLTFSSFTLLKPNEKAPAPKTPPALVSAMARGRADYDARKAAARAAFVASLKASNERDGVRNDRILFGIGTGMDQVRPKEAVNLRSAREVKVRLARNEWEGRQVFVTPAGDGLKGVSVAVSPLLLQEPWYRRIASGKTYFPRDHVKVSVEGHVETTSAPRYGVGYCEPTNAAPGYVRKTKKADLGWWPDLLLDYLDAVDVAAGDTQGFWISVHAPEGQKPGVYTGKLRIAAEGVRPVELPFSVRVNAFTLPRTPVIPTLVSFSPGAYVAPDHVAEHKKLAEVFKADPDSPINRWKDHEDAWCDFLADHFITMAPMYHHGFELPWKQWERLSKQGRMGWFNLSYFSSQPFDGSEKTRKNFKTWSDWVASVIEKNYAKAKEVGVADRALVYCCDEARPERFPEIDAVMAKMKVRFPQVPFLTTTFDDDFGTAKHLHQMDWFCPQPNKFDVAKAEKSRAAGHKVWWYFACDQRAPYANIYTECPPIEIRQLMGAAAAKYRPDGFLYYQCAYFNNCECVTGGPYTDWNPRSWWNQHGDATWVGVGPGGRPLSTIRLENFRDGFEDLAYARLVEEKTGQPVEVPREIHDSVTNFSDDPMAIERWRDRMADILERGRTGVQ